jgi:hypothetical protein
MNRRQFLVTLGSVAATHGVASSNLAPQENSAAGSSVLSLRNGPSRLDLFPGPDGYGLALYTSIKGKMERVADATYPVRVFYGTRTPESLVNVAFRHVSKTRDALIASAVFSDKRSNRWEATFRAARTANAGFLCSFDYQLLQGAAEDIFFEHSLTPDMPANGEETYVLMPGLLYDGNRATQPAQAHSIPQLAAAQNFQVDTPIFTLSMPVAVFHEKRSGRTLMVLLTEPTTTLDMSGFSCVARPDDHRISVMAPCYREKHFHHEHYDPERPKGGSISQGTRFSVPVTYFAMVCPDIIGLFDALQPVRKMVRTEFKRTNRMPLSKAAALVENNLNTRMWADAPENHFYINAMFPDYDLVKSGVTGLYPGWQLQVGWCAGVITGYALLKMGDGLSCQRSRTMLDKIASGGVSPSGLFWSIFANGKWVTAVSNGQGIQHMRVPADATFYYMKAIALERSRGLEHPDWEKAAISNLDAFTRLWTEHHDFGHRVDRSTLAIAEPGTAAGALCIGGLALGASLPRGKEYLAVAREASDAFYERYVRTGWIVAGPLDIPNAPDSESATALLESYVTMYEVTKDLLYLKYARETTKHLSTWVVAYNATFPEGTFCQDYGVQSIGGVLANVQNHHIGPSFCTNSGSALLRLHQYTGDTLPLELLEDVMSGLPQYVCTGKNPFRRMSPGMVSEQFNMTDELGARGEMGWVSASWPATCVLLSYGELPSVFVDSNTGRCAIFDQIEANFDAKSHSVHLSNPTLHQAKIRIQKNHGGDLNVLLAAGETKVVSLAHEGNI